MAIGMDLEGRIWSLGLRGKGELLRERKRTCGWCFNVWKQKKDPSTCYRVASPDNPEENLEYPGKSRVSGFNPGVSGFTPTPGNESEFEQNFDLICDGLTQVTN